MSGSRPADVPANEPATTSAAPTAPDNGVVPADTSAEFREIPADSQSAPADKPETTETLLDVTRRAAMEGVTPAPKADDPKPTEAAADDKAAPEAGDDKGEGAKQDESADAEPPFHKHPRWQEVQRDRAELRRKVEALEPDAAVHRDVLAYMDRHGLTPADVQNGFAIMAALRNDPAEAWKLLKPIVDGVQAFVGETLPDDLRQRVDDGLVDEDTARETARLRNQEALRQVRAERDAARQAERSGQATAEAVRATVQAVDAWVAAKAADPDHAAILPLLEGETLRLQRDWTAKGQTFHTPEAAKALMNSAYENVRKSLAPKRVPVRSTPASSPPAATTKAPATLLDAVRAAARA